MVQRWTTAIIRPSDNGGFVAYGDYLQVIKDIADLRLAAQRYETARRMSPRQWADAWKLNISTGKPFDEIIDHMRPFMAHNVQGKARE